MITKHSRIQILDVIRGFAIVSIMLLHNIEHFDVYYFSDQLPSWMVALDKLIWDFLFFMFGGKSYAIFALMFGVTFAIQLTNQEQRGKPFRSRFAWRLLLLFGFGLLNSAFFQGDILTIYAVIGLLLIPLSKLSEKVLLWLAAFLMLLPFEWFQLYYALQHPLEKISDPVSWTYFGNMMAYISNESFMDTAVGNLTNGKIGVLLWNWENGRFFSILALFIFGFILGKRHLFIWSETSKIFWNRLLTISLMAFIPLYLIQTHLESWIESDIIRRSVLTIETAWTNLAFMMVLVSGLTLLFQKPYFKNKLMYFSYFGRMSLSNYIIQSIIGSSIYYGWGLGLYQYTGATYGLLIGITLTIFMGLFCKWWAKRFNQGPFETLWHKATWLGSNY
ncbi:DUF418 domain-containing protein [Yeosuana sp. AK3]